MRSSGAYGRSCRVSSLDQMAEVFASLQQAAGAGRLAHAYLIVGPPRGSGRLLAEALLKLAYCTGTEKPCGTCDLCRRVEAHAHPDITWLEPEKKSRIIGVAQIRELNQRLYQTAYAGGGKAGVILYADRMEAPSANAFLKTLEEPPGQCLLLLVTDQPQGMLPTILSRCQRVTLAAQDAAPDAPWRHDLLEILRGAAPATTMDKLILAARIKRLLDKVKKGLLDAEVQAAGLEADEDEETEDEDEGASRQVVEARAQAKLLKERSDMLQVMLLWHRDLLACAMGAPDEALHFAGDSATLRAKAAGLTYGRALANLRSIETTGRRLDRNISDLTTLEACLLESAWP